MQNIPNSLHSSGRLLLAAWSSLLVLVGCSSPAKTPESVGKQTADYLCAASTRQDESVYARDMQLATEIKSGKIKTQAQLQARYADFNALMKDEDITIKTAKMDSIIAQLDADFPQREDRLAVGRIITRYVDQCDAALQAKRKLRPDPHLLQLRTQLTGTLPAPPTHDSAGNELPPPPPDVVTVDTTGSL